MTEPLKKQSMLEHEAAEMYGRMIECCDIEMAIESGQFKTVEDVLAAMRASITAIEGKLVAAGMIDKSRRWTMTWINGEAIPIRLH